jgi:hypothetical protein
MVEKKGFSTVCKSVIFCPRRGGGGRRNFGRPKQSNDVPIHCAFLHKTPVPPRNVTKQRTPSTGYGQKKMRQNASRRIKSSITCTCWSMVVGFELLTERIVSGMETRCFLQRSRDKFVQRNGRTVRQSRSTRSRLPHVTSVGDLTGRDRR